jgi:hypothetical protein
MTYFFRVILAGLSLLISYPALAWDGDCGEALSPLNSITKDVNGNTANNGMVRLAETPTAPPAGIYLACGNFTAKAPYGTTITTQHGDVGTNPDSIDTAPAGESAYGSHVSVAGEPTGYSVLTFVRPTGCRLLVLDGTQKIYTHQITSWTPTSAVVTMSGSLLWCKLR